MGRQVNFIADDADWYELLDFVSASNLLAVPELVASRATPQPTSPNNFVLGPSVGEHFFYLIHDTLSVSQLCYHEIPTEQGVCKLCPRSSPVIELSPSEKHIKIIGPGRIYINTERSQDGYDGVTTGLNSKPLRR